MEAFITPCCNRVVPSLTRKNLEVGKISLDGVLCSYYVCPYTDCESKIIARMNKRYMLKELR